jgi:hypothetical protein
MLAPIMDMQTLLFILVFVLSSCNNSEDIIESHPLSDKKTSYNHPENFTTPSGQEILFLVKDNKYYVQWRQSDSLRTLDYPFDLIENGHVSFPSFVAESKNYILLNSGCGSPCWLGLFLPLDKNASPEIVNEYISFDLNAGVVAHISGADSISILNLKTHSKQFFYPSKCEAVFPGECIDTAYFKDKTFYYAWTSETSFDDKKAKIRKYILTK